MTSQQAGPRFYAVLLVQQRMDGVEMWTASHPALLGCHVVCRTAQEAVDNLAEVREEWLARARAAGEDVPQPESMITYELALAPDHTDEEADIARQAVSSTTDQVHTFRSPVLTFA